MADLRAAYEAGFGALEIRDTKLQAYLDQGGSLYALRQEFSGIGVAAASLNALERSTLATGPAREAMLRRCRMMCEWAAGIDCPFVVAVPSPLSDAPERSQVRSMTIEALRAMAVVAARYRVRIGFEFLGFANCSVNTLAAAREVVEAVNDPAVGLVIDAFHFYIGNSTWEMLDGLRPDHLFLVHLDDAEDRPRQRLTDEHRLLPGDGVIPLRELVRRLEALGYRGLYSVELFRPEYYAWDPFELAQTALRKMQAVIGDLVISD